MMNAKEGATQRTIQKIEIGKIRPGRFNARRIKGDITDLKQSIQKIGLLQQITVRPIDDAEGFTHEVVFGDDRLRAVKELGWKTIDCNVRELTDQESYIISSEENERRSDISPFEKAISYAIAVGMDQKIIKAALKKINIDTYEEFDKPFTKTELGREIGITSASVDNIIEPILWSDGLLRLHMDDGLPKKLCREIRIHTKEGYQQDWIGKKLVEIMSRGNHIDKKDLNKFLKTLDNYTIDDLEKLLHVVFDKNQRKIHITNRDFLKLCNTMCKAFNIHPEDTYEVDESISDAVSEEHDPDNEEVVVEEKKKSKVPSNETSDDGEKWDPGDGIPSNVVVDETPSSSSDDEEKGSVSRVLESYIEEHISKATDEHKIIMRVFFKYVNDNYNSSIDFIMDYFKIKEVDVDKLLKEYGSNA